MPAKTKNFCFLHFVNFLFFAKNSGAKNKKMKDQIFNYFQFSLKFLEFFEKNPLFWGFFLRKFHFFAEILVIFLKFGICGVISRNISAEIFFRFFLFFVRKKPNFFLFFAKNQNAKKMATISLIYSG